MKINLTQLVQKINNQILAFVFCSISFFQAHSQAQYCTTLHNNPCLMVHELKNIQISGTSFLYNDTICTSNNVYTNSLPSGTHSAILQKGNTYSFSVTSAFFATPYKIGCWIDYNRDTVFGSNEFTLISANAINYVANTVNLTIPANAATGFTRMRFRSKTTGSIQLNAQDACTLFQVGESLDFMIYIRDNSACIGPTAGTTIASKDTICPFDTLLLSLNGNSDGANQTYQWQSSPDSINWTNLPGENFMKTTFTVLPSTAYFRCALTCSGNTVYSNPVFVYKKPLNNCYCTSASNEPQPSTRKNVDIGYFAISNLVNFTDSTAYNNATAINNYSDFTSLTPINLGKGIWEPFTVRFITDTSGSIDYFYYDLTIYVDGDQNGEFNFWTERYSYNGQTNTNELTPWIKLPYYTKLGLTRMRLVAEPYAQNISSLPCSIYNEGETEDYMVNVLLGTDVENTELQLEDITIYPNPTSQILNIVCNTNTTKGTQLRLLNLNGQLLFEDLLQNQYNKALDVSQYPKGLYVLQVISNENVFIKKVIVE